MISRRGLLMAFLAMPARKPGFHVFGKLDATDQEAQEGYFAIGKELMIVTKPRSPIHDDLQMMRGLEVQVSVFVP